MSKVDLHLHSTASDGSLSPAEVVEAAANSGMGGLALTDHDTVAGVPEASEACDRLGIRFLVGAEISANEPGKSIHLLAYGFDPEHSGLAEFLEQTCRQRVERVHRMVERLNAVGIPITAEDVLVESGTGSATRAHVARALIVGGWVRDVGEVFGRYIGRGGPGFVEKAPTPPVGVFELVHAAAGVTLLAHPGGGFSVEDMERWVSEGLDGIEILHPSHSPKQRRVLEELIQRRHLLRGGGSDWHGPGSGSAQIGSLSVPMEWMEVLAERSGRGTGFG